MATGANTEAGRRHLSPKAASEWARWRDERGLPADWRATEPQGNEGMCGGLGGRDRSDQRAPSPYKKVPETRVANPCNEQVCNFLRDHTFMSSSCTYQFPNLGVLYHQPALQPRKVRSMLPVVSREAATAEVGAADVKPGDEGESFHSVPVAAREAGAAVPVVAAGGTHADALCAEKVTASCDRTVRPVERSSLSSPDRRRAARGREGDCLLPTLPGIHREIPTLQTPQPPAYQRSTRPFRTA